MKKIIYDEELLEIIEGASVLKMLALADGEDFTERGDFLNSLSENLYDLTYTISMREPTEEKHECCEHVTKNNDDCIKKENPFDNPSGLVIAIGLSEMDKDQIGRKFAYLTLNPYPEVVPKEDKRYLVKTVQDKYDFMYYDGAMRKWVNPNNDYCPCLDGYVCAWLELI